MDAGERGMWPSRRDFIRGATVAAASSVLPLASGAALAQRIEIDECRTIDESGEYVLADDLSADGDCLRLAAESISIEGNDHRLIGDGSGGGLVIDAATDRLDVTVEVTDLGIEGFEYGVEFEAAPATLALADVDIRDSDQGIRLRNVPDRVALDIRDSSIRHCHSALFGGFDDRLSMVDSTLCDHIGQAVHLGEGVVLEVSHSTIHDNGGGLLVGPHGSMHLVDVAVEGNENTGIGLWMAGTCEVFASTVRNNGGPGLEVIEGIADVDIVDSVFEGNGDSAVLIHGEEVAVTIDKCEIRDNDGGVTATSIRDSSVVGNGRHAIRLRSVNAAEVAATGNEIRETDGAAIVVVDGSGTITENTMANNLFGVAIPEGWSGELAIGRNNIEGNREFGVRNRSGTTVDATCTYWGDASGPEHADNPDGRGDPVSDEVVFRPWSMGPVEDGETECQGGIDPTPAEETPPPPATPTPTPTPVATPTPTPDDPTPPPAEPTPALEDPVPAFGAGGALASLIGLAYLLKRRVERDARAQAR